MCAFIASRSPDLDYSLQSQVSGYLFFFFNDPSATERAMGRTEGLANQAQTGISAAEQRLSDVSAPGRSAAMFQEFANPALGLARQGAAARGIAGTGSAQGEEEGLLRQMTSDWLTQQGGQQDAATQSLMNTLGGAANINQGVGSLAQLNAALGQTGIDVAGQGMNALPVYAQLLAQQYNLPMSTASNVLSMLQGSQNPAMQLLQLTSPTVGQEGKQMGILK